jgi:hypothetical protein
MGPGLARGWAGWGLPETLVKVDDSLACFYNALTVWSVACGYAGPIEQGFSRKERSMKRVFALLVFGVCFVFATGQADAGHRRDRCCGSTTSCCEATPCCGQAGTSCCGQASTSCCGQASTSCCGQVATTSCCGQTSSCGQSNACCGQQVSHRWRLRGRNNNSCCAQTAPCCGSVQTGAPAMAQTAAPLKAVVMQ